MPELPLKRCLVVRIHYFDTRQTLELMRDAGSSRDERFSQQEWLYEAVAKSFRHGRMNDEVDVAQQPDGIFDRQAPDKTNSSLEVVPSHEVSAGLELLAVPGQYQTNIFQVVGDRLEDAKKHHMTLTDLKIGKAPNESSAS
jgi:hypothetical protein